MARLHNLRIAALAMVGLAMGSAGLGCAATMRSGDDESSEGGGGTDGAGGSGGAGGMNPGACALDCAAIETPPCLKGVCNAMTGECEVVPEVKGAPCDDGLFCTVADFCKDGACVGGATNDCGMDVPECTESQCYEGSKSCALVPAQDGVACVAEGDLCVVNTVCKSGVCKGAKKDCFFAPVPDVCHVGVCNPATGVCEPQPGNEGADCPNDGDLCMIDKTCAAGVCQGGVPKDCTAFTNGCNNGVCDPVNGACKGEPIPPGGACLEAADECNTGICDNNGSCNPVPTPGVQCASGTDACHIGTCDAAGKCASAPANEGAVCEDGNMCTTGETCLAGACQGGVVGNYVAYFTETFASNTAGWTLDTEWQIGPAMASPGSADYGNEDPAMDHTPTADNGIAGVVIGGYESSAANHPQYYLTSPVIDTSGAAGSVYLEFYRWLNSDYSPYMTNTIDVYDGAAWQSVWASGGSPGVQDAAWTHVTHDLTAYKNAAMKIRFGFDIGDSSIVYTVSSWNIDDVVVANAVCNP